MVESVRMVSVSTRAWLIINQVEEERKCALGDQLLQTDNSRGTVRQNYATWTEEPNLIG